MKGFVSQNDVQNRSSPERSDGLSLQVEPQVSMIWRVMRMSSRILYMTVMCAQTLNIR